jgi:hypothetical protein
MKVQLCRIALVLAVAFSGTCVVAEPGSENAQDRRIQDPFPDEDIQVLGRLLRAVAVRLPVLVEHQSTRMDDEDLDFRVTAAISSIRELTLKRRDSDFANLFRRLESLDPIADGGLVKMGDARTKEWIDGAEAVSLSKFLLTEAILYRGYPTRGPDFVRSAAAARGAFMLEPAQSHVRAGEPPRKYSSDFDIAAHTEAFTSMAAFLRLIPDLMAAEAAKAKSDQDRLQAVAELDALSVSTLRMFQRNYTLMDQIEQRVRLGAAATHRRSWEQRRTIPDERNEALLQVCHLVCPGAPVGFNEPPTRVWVYSGKTEYPKVVPTFDGFSAQAPPNEAVFGERLAKMRMMIAPPSDSSCGGKLRKLDERNRTHFF